MVGTLHTYKKFWNSDCLASVGNKKWGKLIMKSNGHDSLSSKEQTSNSLSKSLEKEMTGMK